MLWKVKAYFSRQTHHLSTLVLRNEVSFSFDFLLFFSLFFQQQPLTASHCVVNVDV